MFMKAIIQIQLPTTAELSIIIAGPEEPSTLNHYLNPLIDDLCDSRKCGVWSSTSESMIYGTSSGRSTSTSGAPYCPYVDALVKKVLQWNTVVLTGVPHRVVHDDIHTDSDGNTYFVPTCALVVANIWLVDILSDPPS
ncbi:uncharacterized protein ARMOST_22248 [Armillaria ostoyae]|uniref:Uncharacterized protein n=1 Tax=Armillaria ostoyae TaxID=47428 RepID=A0A284SCB8_ARMOS|nr:uncharacterized protein ARMOST_22248 [Armillaria ostoyae]